MRQLAPVITAYSRRLQVWLARSDRVSIGANLNTMGSLMLDAAVDGRIVIGSDCSFNRNVQISAGPTHTIRVGDAVLLGANVVLRNGNHAWRDPDRRIRDQGHECSDITVGDDVWIGANSTILPGVTLEHGCVVAAGSVVRRGRYGPNAVLAGNPATVVSRRG